MPWLDITCEQCGKSIHIYHNPNAPAPRFCNRTCSLQWFREHPRDTKIDKTCPVCKTNFRVYPSLERITYCSQKCRHEAGPSPDARKNMSEAQKRNPHRYWLGKKRSPETIKKLSKAPHPAGKEHPRWNGDSIECVCQWCGKVFYMRPHDFDAPGRGTHCSLECNGAAAHARMATISPTSIEKAFQDELDRRGILYEFQYPIDKCSVDFAFPGSRLVVEVDGKYWHNLEGAKHKDRRRDYFLRNRGWKVLRFGEDEINTDVAKCVDKILKHL